MKNNKFLHFVLDNIKFFILAFGILGIALFVASVFPFIMFTTSHELFPYVRSFSIYNYGFGGTFFSSDGKSYAVVSGSPMGLGMSLSAISILILSILMMAFSFKKNLARAIFLCAVQEFYAVITIGVATTYYAILEGVIPLAYLNIGTFYTLLIMSIVGIILPIFIIPFAFVSAIKERQINAKKTKEAYDNLNKPSPTISSEEKPVYRQASLQNVPGKTAIEERRIKLLKEYKELYDDGAITKEEYEEKKKHILEEE